jgi:hypothetical protein
MKSAPLPKGQSQLEVKATLRHRDKVNDTASVTFNIEPYEQAMERYVGWAARILDNHSTRDRILDNNLAGVWKTKCKSAERAVEEMRVALIKCVSFTRIIGELHQPSIEDTEDVDHILSNGDCRRVREAHEAAMAALETHPPDDDDMEPDYFGKILPEGERLCIQCGKIHRTDEACQRNENATGQAHEHKTL